MAGFFDEALALVCPEIAGGDTLNLLNVFYGAELMNRGVLLEGLRVWGKVDPWGAREVVLANKLVHPGVLLNAVAEQQHGEFGKRTKAGLIDLVAGALLGPRVTLVPEFYGQAGSFVTRVVGTKHEGRGDRLSEFTPGDRVRLWHDKTNMYDSTAVRVAAGNQFGWCEVGFLRRPIAKKLALRMMQGAVAEGEIAVLLGPQADPNERLYIGVRVWEEVKMDMESEVGEGMPYCKPQA